MHTLDIILAIIASVIVLAESLRGKEQRCAVGEGASRSISPASHDVHYCGDIEMLGKVGKAHLHIQSDHTSTLRQLMASTNGTID